MCKHQQLALLVESPFRHRTKFNLNTRSDEGDIIWLEPISGTPKKRFETDNVRQTRPKDVQKESTPRTLGIMNGRNVEDKTALFQHRLSRPHQSQMFNWYLAVVIVYEVLRREFYKAEQPARTRPGRCHQ